MPYAFKDLHWRRDIPIKDYLVPRSLQEALDMLSSYNGQARVIAGGTDVVPQLRSGESKTEALVDISGLPGMNLIEENGDTITLGGLVTHAQVAASALLRAKAGLLVDGAAAVGSPQIRNVATVAGNLVSGQPAADTAIPLLALSASVSILSKEGAREIPLTEFFLDFGKTALDCSREIMTSIRFPALKDNQGGCFLRLAKRRALALPMLVCAVSVGVNRQKNRIEEAAIALGPVAPVPYRAARAEAGLRDAAITWETLHRAAENSLTECNPRDSLLRGSCDYRLEMVKVLVKRGLARALEQAGTPLA